MRQRVTFGTLAALVATAHADGGVVVGGSPRAIGRAGTATVGDDGGGALLVNPAALARRDTWRIQLGAGVIDDAVTFRSLDRDAPPATNQAGPAIVPMLAIEGSIGDWVIGGGAMTSGVTDRALRSPSDLPYTELGNAFDYRYAGSAGELRRDTLTLGVARRLGDQLAVGLAVAGSRVTVGETRAVWAGFDGRDRLADPKNDLEVSLRAHDPFVPSAVLGVLVAPTDTPLELGGSIAWSQDIAASGTAAATGTADGPSVSGAGTARLAVRQPWTLRAGARYLGERLVVEVGFDYWRYAERAENWAIDGLAIRDPSGFTSKLDAVTSRIIEHTHAAMRGACDVNLIEGLLWATAGYAYTRGGTDLGHLSPTFGELGGHTVAVGLEATAGGVTITLGWSRTFETPHPLVVSGLSLDNPFHAGDARSFGGTFGGSIDQIGIVLDVEK